MDHFSPNEQEYIVVCVSCVAPVIRPEYDRIARPTRTSQMELYNPSPLALRATLLWWIRSALGEAVPITALVCLQVWLQSPTYAYSQPRITTSLTAAQYNSGTVRVVPTEGDYLHFSNDSDIWTFPIPTTGTEGVSEPHMTYQFGSEVFIPDKVSWSKCIDSVSKPRTG